MIRQFVLLDLLMPGGIDGSETTRRILQQAPGVRVIALTVSTDDARMMGVLRAGATGYVRKDAEPETLLAAVRTVARADTFIGPAVAAQLVGTFSPARELTPSRLLCSVRSRSAGRTRRSPQPWQSATRP